MSDIIHRLVARAMASGDRDRALQPRPDWQLLPAMPALVDHEAESSGHEPWPLPAAPGAVRRERAAVMSAEAGPPEVPGRTRELRSSRGPVGPVRGPASMSSPAERITDAPIEPSEQRTEPVRASRTAAAVQPLPGPALRDAPVVAAPATAQSGAPIVNTSEPRQARAVEQGEAAIAAPAQTSRSAPPLVSTAFPPRVIPRVVLETAADSGGAPHVRRDSPVRGEREPGRVAESPAVHVTIGRLEIRAPQAPPPSPGARAPRGTGLDHYLRTRAGGERR